MGRGSEERQVTAVARGAAGKFSVGDRVEIRGNYDDIPDGTFGTVRLVPGQEGLHSYMVRCQDQDGRWVTPELPADVLVKVK